MTFFHGLQIFYYIYKANSFPDKTPNIRGNRTTNEEVKYICCLKLLLQSLFSEIQREKSTRTKPAHTYVYMATYKTRFSLQTG